MRPLPLLFNNTVTAESPGARMINYTERITHLMHDIVARVGALSFINLEEVLVFGRFGRTGAQGAFATCHCMTLPPTEPGHFFWRDRHTGKLTHCSEWFVTKTPLVHVHQKRVNYLISFTLPRFCDQRLEGSRKEELYPGGRSWIAKLDTIVHELYHIDPQSSGIRSFLSADGEPSPVSHPPGFLEEVALMVHEYLATRPDPAVYDFLQYSFSDLNSTFGSVAATTFSTFPSFPQRYLEPLADQPTPPRDVHVQPIKRTTQPVHYTEAHLDVRQFCDRTAHRVARTSPKPGARTVRLQPPAPARLDQAADAGIPNP